MKNRQKRGGDSDHYSDHVFPPFRKSRLSPTIIPTYSQIAKKILDHYSDHFEGTTTILKAIQARLTTIIPTFFEGVRPVAFDHTHTPL